MRIIPRTYFRYKFANSVFNGLTVGAIFTMYAPLDPSIFSIGGILLAIGLIIVAKFYDRLIEIRKFFQISMLVELVMVGAVLAYLIHPYTYITALLIYGGYQFVFTFGSYLVRTETLFLPRKKLLSWLDIYKQSGYLAGLALSWAFYALLSSGFGINDKQETVYLIHWLLLLNELVIIALLYRSFAKEPR